MKLYTRNPFTTFFTLLAGALLLVAGLAFSLILFAILATVGFLVWAYLWWNTRALRRQMRERMQEQQVDGYTARQDTSEGLVIEGEVIREDASESTRRLER